MSSSRFGVLLAIALLLAPRVAKAQACCAASGVLTPGRLGPREFALVGIELHASDVLGNYDEGGHYAAEPGGTHELDFEEDLFAAIRVLRRGQIALLVPFDETWRHEAVLDEPSASAFGGGIGDTNLSARYDFLRSGESRFVPGIAALA